MFYLHFFDFLRAEYYKANILEKNRKYEVLFHLYLSLINMLWISYGQLPWGIDLWGWPGPDGDPVGRGVKLKWFERILGLVREVPEDGKEL